MVSRSDRACGGAGAWAGAWAGAGETGEISRRGAGGGGAGGTRSARSRRRTSFYLAVTLTNRRVAKAVRFNNSLNSNETSSRLLDSPGGPGPLASAKATL